MTDLAAIHVVVDVWLAGLCFSLFDVVCVCAHMCDGEVGPLI